MNEPIHPVQLEALKRATPAQKLEAVAALYETGIRLRMAGLRMTYPDWTDNQLEFEARRSLRHAGTDPFARFLEPLERLALPYCITGSVAASVYGEPRLTADIDVVLLLKLQDVPAVRAAFPEDDYYIPPEETLREEIARDARGMFNLIHHKSQFKADIYIAARDPLHAWALEHRRRIDLAGSGAWIAPPEYVILRKLEFLREGGSDKHLRDIRYILAATAVDRTFIETEVARLEVRAQWLKSAGGN